MIDSSVWKALILHYLEEFASAEYQERIWARGAGPAVSSFEEAYCMFFDNCMAGEELSKKWREIGFTESQWDSINEFAKVLEAFGDEIPNISSPYSILTHPDWPMVRNAANKALMQCSNVRIG